jgi:hypothetical protein
MKKRIFLFSALLIGALSFAQAPQKMSYQSVVRDNADVIVSNASVGVQLSILQGSAVGTPVYVETHTAMTNANGLVSLEAGSGSVVSGSMATIDWANGPYFIKSEMDPTGGSTYTVTGTTQLLSTPYALYAAKAGSAVPAGASTQITYNNAGVASGSANNTWDNSTNTHTVTGTSVTTNEQVTALGGAGTRFVQTDNSGNLSAIAFSGVTGSGTANYIPKFTSASVLGNSLLQDNGTSLAMNSLPSALYPFYVFKTQLTATGDGQASIYGYRTRDSQNDGTNYGVGFTNSATAGYNFWGDLYTFGVAGHSYNDYTRTGGVLGANVTGTYWGSLGYKNSGNATFGVYGSAGYSSGVGFLPNTEVSGIGGGFYGVIGSASKGSVIGQLNSGDLFSSYNSGNVYTLGKNIELVETSNNAKTPVYAVTSIESTIYAKGSAQLVNGQAYVTFNDSYKALLGENPEVTVTPKGNCNGVYIASIDKNGFTIKEMNNGSSSVAISWISVGNRIDNRLDKATQMVSDANFDRNVQQVLFNDGNKDGKASGIWWDGTAIKFGEMPASLAKVVRKDK